MTVLPDSSFCCMAMWTMNRFGGRAVSVFSPGSKKTRIAGPDDFDRASIALAAPDALGDEDVCPCGWLCQAVRGPGVKRTSAAAKVEVAAGAATAST